MAKLSRPVLAAEATRLNLEQLARLGGAVRATRHRRRLTQRQLGSSVGLAQSTVSALERGHGGGLTLDTWQRVALALDRPLRVDLASDASETPLDAGHLAIQEIVMRHARAAGLIAHVELPTRPADPRRSADVALIDDRRRCLILAEAWNTFGDIGAAARSFDRKLVEIDGVAIARWGEKMHRAAGVWVVRSTARNRALLARYPEVFAARFPGSSAGWVEALNRGTDPPLRPGLVWCDTRTGRIFAWRRRV